MRTSSMSKYKKEYTEMKTELNEQNKNISYNNLLRRFNSHEIYATAKKGKGNIPHFQKSLRENPIITINLNPSSTSHTETSNSSIKTSNSKRVFSNHQQNKFVKCKSANSDFSKKKETNINSYVNSGRKRNKPEPFKILDDQSIQEVETEGNCKDNINKEVIDANPISITESHQDNSNSMNNFYQKDNFNKQLILATKKGDKKEVSKLLGIKGINVNFQDENGWSALHFSSQKGQLKIVEMLLKSSANPNLKTKEKRTPLHLSAKHGYLDISKLLIENGATLNSLDNEKNLPVHLCAITNNVELLYYMLEKYPSINIKNVNGKTPYDLASKEEAKKAIWKYIQKDKNNQLQKIKIHNTNSKQANSLMKCQNYKASPKTISNKTQNSSNLTSISTKGSTAMNKKQLNVLNHTIQKNNNQVIKTNAKNYNKNSKPENNNNNNNNIIRNSKKSTTEKVKSPIETKNNVVKDKKGETLQNKNSIPIQQKRIYRPNTVNQSNINSHSLSKGKTNSVISKLNNNVNRSQKINSQKMSTQNIQKENILNHKTNSHPKFNRINTTYLKQRNSSKEGSICNRSKSNLQNPNPNIANVEISLEMQKENVTSREEDSEIINEDADILEISNPSHQEEENTSINEKKNEIISMINLSDSENESVNQEEEKETETEEEHIGPSSFICLGILGKGSFGEVYLVKNKKTQELYAMKVLDKSRIMAQNIVKYAMTERNVLSLTSHPFIVKLNYAFQTSEKLFLLLDYCPGGDLAEQLTIETRFPEERAKFYICEIILAIGDLHNKDIIFRDLKPDNVVLDQQGHAMLTDFGLSREGVFDPQIAKSFCGSIAYLAPEMLSRKGHGKAVDWYLLGVLFYEMLVGIPPFFTNDKEQIFKNIERGKLKIPSFVSEPAAKLLKLLLKKDPSTRLGSKNDVEEIKGYEYFKGVDWEKVYNREIVPPKVNQNKQNVQLFKEPKLFMDEEDIQNSNMMKNRRRDYEDQTVQFVGWSFVQNQNLKANQTNNSQI